MSTFKKKPVSKAPSEAQMTEWFLFSTREITAKDLADVLKSSDLGEVDLWEEMNILSLEMPDKTSVDFEYLKGGFKAEEDRKFLEQHGYRAVFSVSLSQESLRVKELFRLILSHIPGAFCGDTVNFEPRITNGEME